MKTTEEDVLCAWRQLVLNAAARPSALEREDREQVAWLGLLYAIRTWRVGMEPFARYAARWIDALLLEANCAERRAKRCQSRLSMDQPLIVGGERVGTWADIIAFRQQTR